MGKTEILRDFLARNPDARVITVGDLPGLTEGDLLGMPLVLDESISVVTPAQADKIRAAYVQVAGRTTRVPVLEGAARGKAEQLAFDVSSLLDGKEDDGLAAILVPVRDFLQQLAGVSFFNEAGSLRNADGTRSIFDDVDE